MLSRLAASLTFKGFVPALDVECLCPATGTSSGYPPSISATVYFTDNLLYKAWLKQGTVVIGQSEATACPHVKLKSARETWWRVVAVLIRPV